MPENPSGKADSPASDNPLGQSTLPPVPASGTVPRSALAQWLTQVGPAEPEPESTLEAPAPAVSPEQAEAPPEPSGDGENAAEGEQAGDHSQEPPRPQSGDEPEPAATAEAEGATPGVQKRIDGLRRKLGDAERDRERLRTELDEMRQEIREMRTEGRQPAPAQAPVAQAIHARQAQWNEERARLDRALDAIESNPEGLTIGDQTWTPEQLRAERRRYQTRLSAIEFEESQFNREMAAQGAAMDAQAAVWHPWLKDRSHANTLLIEGILQEWPGLARLPGFRAILADAITFRRSQEKRSSAPSPAKPPPKTPPASAAIPTPAPTQADRLRAAREKVMQDRSRASLMSYLQAAGS